MIFCTGCVGEELTSTVNIMSLPEMSLRVKPAHKDVGRGWTGLQRIQTHMDSSQDYVQHRLPELGRTKTLVDHSSEALCKVFEVAIANAAIHDCREWHTRPKQAKGSQENRNCRRAEALVR